MAGEVSDDWTEYSAFGKGRFEGETLLKALQKALKAREEFLAKLKP